MLNRVKSRENSDELSSVILVSFYKNPTRGEVSFSIIKSRKFEQNSLNLLAVAPPFKSMCLHCVARRMG